MNTYEVLTLLILFGTFLIVLLAYIDRLSRVFLYRLHPPVDFLIYSHTSYISSSIYPVLNSSLSFQRI
ncbi:MAG: putative holin-like toxin [Lachnoclostridium sp.]|nr:putative holin-like toxin [Lachnospiraceae bacterium]MCM1249486.1 putative holin-like toxin [Lachnoclostridium sp.]MCM1536522.1 putative holin-like toxin [Clostridium sp.]